MKHQVLNNKIGTAYDLRYPKLNANQENQILAGIFEQLLLFDQITVTTDRTSFPLFFLINKLGINKVEELIERKYIKFLLWTPLLFTTTGSKREDGSIDESRIYELPPLQAAELSPEERDPETNIQNALSKFSLNRDKRRIFTRTALKAYEVPRGLEFSTQSAQLIIEAYVNNNLAELGLPFEKDPEQLDLETRRKLLNLGSSALETALLSKYHLKSFDNYEHLKVCQSNLQNIGNALKVSENASEILRFENIPDLKELFISEKLDFNSVTELRYKSASKHFRKWLNETSDKEDALPITKEYLNEIKGTNKFFESTGGKFLRTISMFGISTALEMAVQGAVSGLGLGLGMIETFWLDSILKGKNPSMFIKDLEKEIK